MPPPDRVVVSASIPPPSFLDHRRHIETIFLQALRTVDPYSLVRKAIQESEGQLQLGGLTLAPRPRASLFLIALGKAAARMTQSVLEFPELQPTAAVIAIPSSDRTVFPHVLQVFRAGHPHPTEASLEAGRAALRMLTQCTADDLLLVLISGGGSSLFDLPAAGIELDDLSVLTELLLRSGLSIQQMNSIRSALSQTKAGGLARLAAPAQVVSLILSDVVGDPLSSIASGPTVLGPDRRRQARLLLEQSGLWDDTPLRIRAALDQAGPPRRKAPRPVNILLGGNGHLIDGAAEIASNLGFQTEILSRQMHGEARQAGRRFGRKLRDRLTRVKKPLCLIMGGETTVTVTGAGMGGRNQEFALAAAAEIKGLERVALASLASDGKDGPTDAAGALVDGTTLVRIRTSGVDPDSSMAENDAYAALKAGKALIITGPTGTNVADLALGLIYPEP